MKLERNVFTLLDNRAGSASADDPAFGFEGEMRTFSELRDRALQVAGGLRMQGVRPGDHIAVLLGNRLEWPEVFFGIAALGAVCVPVNVLLTPAEIEHVCLDSKSTVLIMDEVAPTLTPDVMSNVALVVGVGTVEAPGRGRFVAYEDMLVSSPSGPHLPGPALEDTFILYYSSGTTGLPKAAEHTHDGVLWNAMGQISAFNLTAEDRYAVFSSFSWAAGFHNVVLPLVWLGGYSEIRRVGRATAESVVDLLVNSQITHAMIVPSLLRELVANPEVLSRLEHSPMRWILTGSEPVPTALIQGAREVVPSVAVCQGYGVSEFPTTVVVLTPDEALDHDGSAGRALPHVVLAVREEDGDVRRLGKGELLLRSPATMRGYFQQAAQTAEAFRDGWFNTGDLVELDEQGFVTIVGRTKDMIISGGLNVYPKEIEDVIHRIPGVIEAAVVGVPHERFGESAVAIVVTEDGEFDLDVVVAACTEQLASYKRPRQYLLRADRLPRSANAKLLKRELRPWAEGILKSRDGQDS